MRGRIVGSVGAALVVVGLLLGWGPANGLQLLGSLMAEASIALRTPQGVALLLYIVFPTIGAVLALVMWASLATAPAVGATAAIGLLALLWLGLKTGFNLSPAVAPGVLVHGVGAVALVVAAIVGSRERRTLAVRKLADDA